MDISDRHKSSCQNVKPSNIYSGLNYFCSFLANLSLSSKDHMASEKRDCATWPSCWFSKWVFLMLGLFQLLPMHVSASKVQAATLNPCVLLLLAQAPAWLLLQMPETQSGCLLWRPSVTKNWRNSNAIQAWFDKVLQSICIHKSFAFLSLSPSVAKKVSQKCKIFEK